jgi:hypothetical protein
MIDVNKITSVLAKLQDPQLQQYAQMHKNDPYIMALAMSESNRRKEVRAASQGSMQEQPKVVDQEIEKMGDMQSASPEQLARLMQLLEARKQAEHQEFTGQQPQALPEDQGIGQLPAGNMDFAGGGIIAFADGGDVERYQYGGMPPRSLMGDIPGFVAGTGNIIPQQGAPEEVPLLRRMFRDARAAGTSYQVEQAKARIAAGVGTSADEAILAAAQPAQSTAPSPQDMAQFDAASNLYMTERAAKQAAAAPKAPDAAPKADAGQKGTGQRTGAGSGAAAAGAPKGSGSLEALYKKLQPSETEYAAVAAKETSVANALKSLGKSGIDEFEAEEAKRGDVFKGREARLAEQGKNLEGRKDQNIGLALLQAGAAMMSTPGGLGVALGKGVSVGTERYAAGLDKLNAAQERLMDAKDRLEELRVNREDLTSSERRKLKNQAKQYELEAEKLFLDGAHKKLGYKRDDAKNMFAGITTLLGQETAAGATIEAANIRSRDSKEYLAELRGGNMVETARKNIMADITKANPHADEPTRQRLFQTEWAKALQSNPALAKYAGVASGGGGASSADPLGLR